MKNIFFLHLSLVLYSLGSVAAKLASAQPIYSIRFVGLYSLVLVILFIFALIWQQLLKTVRLNIAVANKSVVIVWGAIWGNLIFGEPISWLFILGSGFILDGIYLLVT